MPRGNGEVRLIPRSVLSQENIWREGGNSLAPMIVFGEIIPRPGMPRNGEVDRSPLVAG